MPEYPTFSFKVVNAQEVSMAFAGLARAVKDWSKIIWPAVVAEAIKPMIREQFETEGQSGPHGSWAKLKPDYATRKLKRWGAQPILVASGEMKRVILSDDNRGNLMPRSMTFEGPRLALIHQASKRKSLPIRRVMDPGDKFKKAARVAITRGVAREARRLGFAVKGDASAAEASALGRSILGAGL